MERTYGLQADAGGNWNLIRSPVLTYSRGHSSKLPGDARRSSLSLVSRALVRGLFRRRRAGSTERCGGLAPQRYVIRIGDGDVSEQMNGTFVIAAGVRSVSTTLVRLRKKEEVIRLCSALQGGSFLERSDRLVPQLVPDTRPPAASFKPLYPTCSAQASPHYAQLFLRSSSDRVLTFNVQVEWICKHWPTRLSIETRQFFDERKCPCT
jgi:hypothetical protein